MKYKYHHIGLIVDSTQENEEHNEDMKYFASGYCESQYGIELLRFEEDSPIHPLIKSVPHVAFEVDDLEEAVGDYPIIEKLSSPEDAVFTCYINVKGTPVELIQFEGHEEEIARPSPSQQNLDYHHFGVNSSF